MLWGGRACRSAPPSVAVIACALAALRALLRALLLLRALAALTESPFSLAMHAVTRAYRTPSAA